jgi:dTDP-4-dehydrorhamnose 3,5-epimerase-like enzyme
MPLPTVTDLKVMQLQRFQDERGVLVPLELEGMLSFAVARLFWINRVPIGGTRGNHAHKVCHQFMICCSGRVDVTAFDGAVERTFAISEAQGLLVPPAIFSMQRFQKSDSSLLVLCDRPYEPDDYLHDHDALRAFRRRCEQAK